MNNPLWLYWNSIDGVEPPYITLCKWAIMHNWSDCNVIFLNQQNIDDYLPGMSQSVQHIEVDVKGRLDKFRRKFVKEKLNEAVKCDVYRANILKAYGGIYCDITSLPVRPIKTLFAILEENEFLITQRSTHGKTHYPVSLYGCNPNSGIISEYCAQISDKLSKNKYFHYTELGADLLSPIIDANLQSAAILPEETNIPIGFEVAEKIYQSNEQAVEDVLTPKTICCKLFNQPFKTVFKKMTMEELYYSEMLIGKLFRYALPETVYSANVEKVSASCAINQ